MSSSGSSASPPVDDRTEPLGRPGIIRHVAVTRLRNRLRLNAAVSLATGAATIMLARSIDPAVSVDGTGLVRVVGGGLIVFAIGLVVLAGARYRRLLVGAGAVIAADALWVAAAGVVSVTATMSARGEMLLGASAVLVGVLAVLQVRALATARVADRGIEDGRDQPAPTETFGVAQ